MSDDIKWDDDDIKWDAPSKTYGPVNPNPSGVASDPSGDAAKTQNAKAFYEARSAEQAYRKKHGLSDMPSGPGDSVPSWEKGATVAGGDATNEGALFSPEKFGKAAAYATAQGLTLNHADELAAAYKAGHISGKEYESEVKKQRADFDQVAHESAGGNLLGEVVGGGVWGAALPAVGAAGAVAIGTGLGAIQGEGSSRGSFAHDPWTLAKDAAIGGGVGGGTALLGSLLAGGRASGAADRTNQRTSDALGFKGMRTHKNNIAAFGQRVANESPELAREGNQIDLYLRDALDDVNAVTPGSRPITMRDIAKEGAENAAHDDKAAVKVLADYARKTGVDPFGRNYDGTKALGAANNVAQTTGRRIGEIDDAFNSATGGIPMADVKAEFQSIIDKYAKMPGAAAAGRSGNAERVIKDLEGIYPPSRNTLFDKFAAGDKQIPLYGESKIPVSEFRASKKMVGDSAYAGNATANPSLAKEGEQELTAAMNSVLKGHFRKNSDLSTELESLSSELPELNRQYGFSKAVGASQAYRAKGDISGQWNAGKLFNSTAPLSTQAYNAVGSALAPIAQKRDQVIAYLMRLGESESSAKKLAAKITDRLVRATPQAMRSGAVDTTHRFADHGDQSNAQPLDTKFDPNEENLNAAVPFNPD